ncbi:MAG: tRNA dimethylallyltransferase [Candidatus Kaiserbacteria bacterium]|nr:tRNA dimethylallyltransferase [Candidatus Kaiserbacteria bacterium]
MKQKLLIIVGPTSSGKSALGVELAKKFDGEIISADSRQVYKGLNIGTGKITKREMKGVPHHLLDVANPKKAFSADDFVKHARRAIQEIASRGKLPIIVGGTGFYIDSLVGRIALPDVPPNRKLRAILDKKMLAQLFTMLEKKDPARAKALSTPSERNNKVRLIRALEIVHALGTVPTPRGPLGYDAMWIGVNRRDAALRERIDKRLKDRIKKGMVKEAESLKKAGLSFKRMGELGLEYRSLAKVLQKKLDVAGMQKELQIDIWHYSRKQITYWKRNKNITWFDAEESAKIERLVSMWAT